MPYFVWHLQSIEFHEKGKRHKENVAKRLSEIGKKSRQEHQKNIKVDVEMKKMEEVREKYVNITHITCLAPSMLLPWHI